MTTPTDQTPTAGQDDVWETPPRDDHPTGTKWRDVAAWNSMACRENQEIIRQHNAQLVALREERDRIDQSAVRTTGLLLSEQEATSKLREENERLSRDNLRLHFENVNLKAERDQLRDQLREENAGLEKDKARLDLLEAMCVNVREPLVHGSRDLFWSSPEDDDGTTLRSTIRKDLDALLAKHAPGGEKP